MAKMDFWAFLVPVIYAVLFMAALFGLAIWDRRRRRTRKPFGENVRLLRIPGEYAWRNVIEKDSTELLWTLGLMLVPVLVGGPVLQIASYFFGKSWLAMIVALLVFVCVMALCVVWLVARLKERENRYLGYFGERYVADCLEPLKEKGWFIFHDMQCDGATGKFNLDHVAVGPGGLWIVETKTWRKGRAKEGRERHIVTSNGAAILWPWWDDTESVEDTARNAQWLQDWLKEMTEKKFTVSAVIAIPGYKVEEKRIDGIRVANPKNLQDVLIGYGKVVLSPEDIKTIRLQLAAKCRDVEY